MYESNFWSNLVLTLEEAIHASADWDNRYNFSIVQPTLGSRMAKEQDRQSVVTKWRADMLNCCHWFKPGNVGVKFCTCSIVKWCVHLWRDRSISSDVNDGCITCVRLLFLSAAVTGVSFSACFPGNTLCRVSAASVVLDLHDIALFIVWRLSPLLLCDLHLTRLAYNFSSV